MYIYGGRTCEVRVKACKFIVHALYSQHLRPQNELKTDVSSYPALLLEI